MKYSLLLYGLYKKLQMTARKYPAFRDILKNKNYSVVFKTADRGKGRYYKFIDGKIESTGKNLPEADVSLIWKDAATGFKVMASGGGQVAFMEAMRDGDLLVNGDGQLAVAFINTVKEMFKAPRRARIKKAD